MGLRKNLRQREELGSFATRMLWIPAIVSVLVIGFIGLRAPADGDAAAASVRSAHAAAADVRAVPSTNVLQSKAASPTPPDEAILAHEALDPVGAGHDVPR
jgi:hypothetical protein